MVKKPEQLNYDTSGRAKVVRYATAARKAKINPDSIKVYQKYLRANKNKNRDVASTTYKVYESYFNIFLCFIMEEYDNQYILDPDFLEDMVDIMEDYIGFLQDTLHNGKKAVNTKISAISSFYIWAVKRKENGITAHPFSDRLDRMKGAQDEKIISEYYLSQKQVDEIVAELSLVDKAGSDYDKMDQLIWHIAFDSACRVGALKNLTVSSFRITEDDDGEKNYFFANIREKRGKRVEVAIEPETYQMYLEFLELREELGVECDELFYVRSQGKWQGMSTQSLHARVRKIGHIVGLGDFRPHCIRKTRLNFVADDDIKLAQNLANHESLDTTSRFYTKKKDSSATLASIRKLKKKKLEKQGVE